MGHFSKFIEPGSLRIGVTADRSTPVEYTAFLTPDKSRVLVILNKQDKEEVVDVFEPNVGHIVANLPARSIKTFIWK